jgi:hypothetical protein
MAVKVKVVWAPLGKGSTSDGRESVKNRKLLGKKVEVLVAGNLERVQRPAEKED